MFFVNYGTPWIRLIITMLFCKSVPYVANRYPVRLEGMVNYMSNLLPLLSLQVHCYPECLEEVRPRQPRGGREAANGSCTAVLLFTLCLKVLGS